jgi:signal transduction histidine kinase
MPKTTPRGFFETILSLLSLVIILVLTYMNFFIRPYPGLYYNVKSGIIEAVFSTNPPHQSIHVGDRLLKIGDISFQQVLADPNLAIFTGLKPGDVIPLVIERDGQSITVDYIYPGANHTEILGRLSSQWPIPIVFWLSGLVTLLFIRPRSTLTLLMALFFYLTAVWIAAGLVGSARLPGTNIVMFIGVWLSFPLYWHFHWYFPRPLGKLPVFVVVAGYILGIILAVLQVSGVFPISAYSLGFVLAILGSFVLMVMHFFRQSDERRTLSGILIAATISLVPMIILTIASSLIPNSFWFSVAAVTGFSALPGYYFFIIYRRQVTSRSVLINRLFNIYLIAIMGNMVFTVAAGVFNQWAAVKYINIQSTIFMFFMLTSLTISFTPFLILPALGNAEIVVPTDRGMRIRANRLAAVVLYMMLVLFLTAAIFIWLSIIVYPAWVLLAYAIAASLVTAAALAGFTPFERFFQKVILGMTLTPETLTQTYSGRITTSLEASALHKLLLDEVFPSLLVRQFAQVLNRAGTLSLDFGLRVTPDMLPTPGQSSRLDALCGKSLDPHASRLPAWIRVVVPLHINQQTSGYWLLGQRDPDDVYTRDDVATLQALAGQTALALVNIEQSDALRALYFADIDRHETERLHLASELHDDVLNQMGQLHANLQDTSPEVLKAYDQAVFHIREIINGLRPAMLNYGLSFAFKGLADELNDRLDGKPRFEVEIPPAGWRYAERVELYLFRIVQQACQNAVAHAECKTIRITGSLAQGEVNLLVTDDGKGFPSGSRIDLPELLAHKHFGLAGMFERAALIGASLKIESQPGQGSQVVLNWNVPGG